MVSGEGSLKVPMMAKSSKQKARPSNKVKRGWKSIMKPFKNVRVDLKIE